MLYLEAIKRVPFQCSFDWDLAGFGYALGLIGENMQRLKSFWKGVRRRVRYAIAIVLAVTILGSTLMTTLAASRVTISSGERSDAAQNYLVESTEYVSQTIHQRMLEYLTAKGSEEDFESLYTLASVNIAKEDHTKALVYIEKCIALLDTDEPIKFLNSDIYSDLWLKKSCLLVLLGEYERALAALEQTIELDATISEAYLVRAQVAAELGDISGVLSNLERYLQLEPEDENIPKVLEELVAEISAQEQALLQPQTAEATVESEYLQGLYAIQSGDFSLGEQAITRAIGIDSEYMGLFYYRGICRLSLKNYFEAAEDFTHSINRGVMVQSSFYNRGIALILDDRYEEGVADIIIASEDSSDDDTKARALAFLEQIRQAELDDFLLKAQASAEAGDIPSMAANLGAYLDQVPDDTAIRAMYAKVLFAGENYLEALEQYAMVLKTDPSAENEFHFGLAALQLSEFALAEEAFTRSISLEDTCEGIYYYRGVCRLSLGNYEDAAGDFTTSIKKKEMAHSSFYNRGISRLMTEKAEQGLEDIKLAATLEEDPEVAAEAQKFLTEIQMEHNS